MTRATGVQIYTCAAAKDNPAHYAWAFTAPEAELFDAAGKKIGTHYAGPTWEADDGSKVVGAVAARSDAPDSGAIPWLLLVGQAEPQEGRLARTSHIQRLSTVGGKAPADGCDAARVGQVRRIPYEAAYYFYRQG
ncbi:DUF3455 domain-containing protein [Eleftheria terrae]|uniref:DUF3455 domain-containing protein n=1 Tax=Eleftheria terrae TaxID=1597781 RepID=UPI00263B4E25|nr:DUF3455 domain-containing protein [Eleftheria terrae]WKB55000.1 DUF3455 domain-containing protein [Eleftheria terrae]